MKLTLLVLVILLVSIVLYLATYGYGSCGGFVGKECPAGFWCKTGVSSPVDGLGKCVFNPFLK